MIKYKSGYKYILYEDYFINLGISPSFNIETDFITIKDGTLYIKKGYAWDGASGPAIDTKNFMRSSLVHDALYQVIREEKLPKSYRLRADNILKNICLEDGMSKIRVWWVYKGVRLGGSLAIKNFRDILVAP